MVGPEDRACHWRRRSWGGTTGDEQEDRRGPSERRCWVPPLRDQTGLGNPEKLKDLLLENHRTMYGEIMGI